MQFPIPCCSLVGGRGEMDERAAFIRFVFSGIISLVGVQSFPATSEHSSLLSFHPDRSAVSSLPLTLLTRSSEKKTSILASN